MAGEAVPMTDHLGQSGATDYDWFCVDDAPVAEMARLRAAAVTLGNIEGACVSGIPRAGLYQAASTVVAAYLDAAVLPSPISTGVER